MESDSISSFTVQQLNVSIPNFVGFEYFYFYYSLVRLFIP